MQDLNQKLKDTQVEILNIRLNNLNKNINRTSINLKKLSDSIANVDKPELLRTRRELYKEYGKLGVKVPTDLDIFPYSQEEQSMLHRGEENIRSFRKQLANNPHEIIIPMIQIIQDLSKRMDKLETLLK